MGKTMHEREWAVSEAPTTDAAAIGERLSATAPRLIPSESPVLLRLSLPRVYGFDEWRARNRIRQLAEPSSTVDGTVATFSRGRVVGHIFHPHSGGPPVLIVPRTKSPPENHARVLAGALDLAEAEHDLTRSPWLKHPLWRTGKTARTPEDEIHSVLESWRGAFHFAAEDVVGQRIGLRAPQIGAVHAVHAHWAVSTEVATVVMPTGTGKTETMLSILVSACCPKVLVVVPTDALRAQLADKFVTMGVLKAPGAEILDPRAKFPLVCTLAHVPRNAEEADKIFTAAQVVVTTSAVASQAQEDVQERMAFHCSHLFIDEAHHAEAPSLARFKARFTARRVLQFTATPFREDGQPLDGKIIFKYPLRKAQQEGYFKPIRFLPVVEFDRRKADARISEAAIAQLRADEVKKHVLMARVDSVARAQDVFRLYERYPEFNPVLLHSGVTSKPERERRRELIISGTARIVVCVDMLGEGFDLPELKIAAFHDIRKSLAVTLQLAGRFTRSRPDLGDATFIANTANVQVDEELRKLYAQDPDWNALLPELSEKLIGEQVSLQEFLANFTEFAAEVPLKSVRPATSTVVYKTNCGGWQPKRFTEGISGIDACEQVYQTVNEAKKTLVVVTARRAAVPWTDAESMFALHWALYVVHWSPEQQLLFINSSENAGEYKTLARAVAGEDVALINGDTVFRTFAGITRLQLQNVGLTEQLGRNVRYTGRMGSDVESGLPDVHRRRARKSVLSGVGFEDGRKVSVGASRKGRIWSHRRERLDELIAWCQGVGAKLLDESIDPEAILRGTLESQRVTSRPAKVPIAVDWPEEIYAAAESRWFIQFEAQLVCIDEVELRVESHEPDGPLRLMLSTENLRSVVTLELFEANENPDYRFVGDGHLSIRKGDVGQARPLVDFFDEAPPVVWFIDGSSLAGNDYIELKGTRPPYDASKITAWDWAGVTFGRSLREMTTQPTASKREWSGN